jgi:hypothetical protein
MLGSGFLTDLCLCEWKKDLRAAVLTREREREREKSGALKRGMQNSHDWKELMKLGKQSV